MKPKEAANVNYDTARKWKKIYEEDSEREIPTKKNKSRQLNENHKAHLINFFDEDSSATIQDAVDNLTISFAGLQIKKSRVAEFMKEQPGSSTLKAEAALPKKIRSVSSKNTFNMIGNNNNIGNIQLGDTYSASESSSMNTKRKANDDFEEITKTKKPCQFEFEGNTEEINSILGKWSKFLENKENFHPFSLEYHHVIRSSMKKRNQTPVKPRTIKPRATKPRAAKPRDVKPIKPTPKPEETPSEPNTATKTKKAQVKWVGLGVPDIEGAQDSEVEEIVEDEEDETRQNIHFQRSIYNFHTTYKDIHDGESEFKGLFLFPFVKAVTATVAAEFGAAKTDFCDGEVCLEAMSTQLKAINMLIDGSSKYNANGLIRMYGYRNLETLLLETSSYFGCSDQSRSKFDHY
ncbi:hypothetical protein INT47_008173 [Mucor saturninus]|uniref:Uncharacterized protein n=1 Tax=Mucor saturninus TaxID=64648 RepID=A0A8H7R5B6_9FUNG|nr:hypothetical protein INT47_008173 [Mucor saturninus]